MLAESNIRFYNKLVILHAWSATNYYDDIDTKPISNFGWPLWGGTPT